MYWIANYRKGRPTKKTITKFVLIPRLCENDHYHWLETVVINKRLIGGTYSTVDAFNNYSPEVWHCNCNIVSDDVNYDVRG